jgi:hypothetical protein
MLMLPIAMVEPVKPTRPAACARLFVYRADRVKLTCLQTSPIGIRKMRVGRSASRTKSLRLSAAAKNSVAAIRDSDDPRAAETFMQFFAQELSANTPPPPPTAPSMPIFGTLTPRRPPRG